MSITNNSPDGQDERARFESWIKTQTTHGSEHVLTKVGGTDERYLSPITSGMWSAWQAALSARQPVRQEPVTDAGRTVAYDAIDRFLRNNMDDATYAAYVEHLEALWVAVPTQETAKAIDLGQFRRVIVKYRDSLTHRRYDAKEVAECNRLLALIDSQSN